MWHILNFLRQFLKLRWVSFEEDQRILVDTAEKIFDFDNIFFPFLFFHIPLFSLSTNEYGCQLDSRAYVWIDQNETWVDYDSTFDFHSNCVSCNGQIKIQKPTDISAYKPFKDYIVKLVATDESSFGNTVES